MGKFTHASLFSGIGGPEVAAAWMGWDNLFHCEINPFGRRVLEYWFPNSESYEDITKTDFTTWRGQVDVLTGGFPCQPFSYAGQRRGAEDDRYLWPQMLRVIDEVRPAWVVGENVAGIATMVEPGEVSEVGGQTSLFGEGDDYQESRVRFTIERICADIEGIGYSVQPVLIPACAVGAPHKRDRVFFIGRRITTDTDCEGLEEWQQRGGWENKKETRTGTDDRVERFGDNGAAPDTAEQQVERDELEQREDGAPQQRQLGGSRRKDGDGWTAPHTTGSGRREILRNIQRELTDGKELVSDGGERDVVAGLGRWDIFPSVAPVHRGNDGLPFDVDRLTIPFGKWRTEALKACGNAIVPQVMYEIFRAIEIAEKETKTSKL